MLILNWSQYIYVLLIQNLCVRDDFAVPMALNLATTSFFPCRDLHTRELLSTTTLFSCWLKKCGVILVWCQHKNSRQKTFIADKINIQDMKSNQKWIQSFPRDSNPISRLQVHEPKLSESWLKKVKAAPLLRLPQQILLTVSSAHKETHTLLAFSALSVRSDFHDIEL